ncbi:hypothetical protein L1049_007171 [Liquidambar formosana]|uniref:Uncharacterized protein n=1 Tax=Liquidambar formosana TaxID=63359 RepID=A0AAP0RIH2_LIQFO
MALLLQENATILPQIFQPSSGIAMTNEINAHPKNALPCFALTKTDSYLFSLSNGEISQFILKTLEFQGYPTPLCVPSMAIIVTVAQTQVSS